MAQLARLLTRCEQQAEWPQQVARAFYALLPKQPGIGQERHIGLTSMLYRLWTIARKDTTDNWLLAKAAWWDTAIKGSGALQAALHRLLLDQLARCDNLHTCTLFSDLTRFYDNIDLRKLLHECERTGFDPMISYM